MAQIYPDIDQINRMRVSPTNGEACLIEFLIQELDDSYEIYFQPFLNGDLPDIIIMRKGAGVLIIEVKDWDLARYTIDEGGCWRLRKNNVQIESPLVQAEKYKKNLYNWHVPGLLDDNLSNRGHWAIIQPCVYFHCETEAKSVAFCSSDPKSKAVHLLGKDCLNQQMFRRLLVACRLNQDSRLFTDSLYERFTQILRPSLHKLEDGKPLQYTDSQKRLIGSAAKSKQKVRGVAGSGKTYVLAKRAVNAYARTGKRVLILTYNITLRNYIHDRISEVRERFEWSNFYIIHYHLFFQFEANRYGLVTSNNLADYDNEAFFASVEGDIEKYESIFIDEIQDYKPEWIKIIRHYFLAEGGEFVVFGDEKQNIYGRPMAEERRPYTGIPGAWNQLGGSWRFHDRIMNLAIAFQSTFLSGRYNLDPNLHTESLPQLGLIAAIQGISYSFLSANSDTSSVIEHILSLREAIQVSSNDVAILSVNVEIVREIEYFLRTDLAEASTRMFETKEQREDLLARMGDTRKFRRTIEDIRRNRKYAFRMNAGTIKLSTIHSFKGWDSPVVFVVIEKQHRYFDDGFHGSKIRIEELIYTAITRCRSRLVIVNWGNEAFHPFFQEAVNGGLIDLGD